MLCKWDKTNKITKAYHFWSETELNVYLLKITGWAFLHTKSTITSEPNVHLNSKTKSILKLRFSCILYSKKKKKSQNWLASEKLYFSWVNPPTQVFWFKEWPYGYLVDYLKQYQTNLYFELEKNQKQTLVPPNMVKTWVTSITLGVKGQGNRNITPW